MIGLKAYGIIIQILLFDMATDKNTSVSTVTYDDVFIKPKRKGKADLVINHQYASEMARMRKKELKEYGDGIISFKPSDEDEFCSFKIQKIKSKADQMIIKGKKGNCEFLPLLFGPTIVSFGWGDFESYDEAEKAAADYGDLLGLADF